MDLDSFKLVNDLFGHDMGDRVLQVFSNILRHSTRERDVISRIGGDEFMAFFTDIMNENAVRSLSERLNSALAEEAARLMGEDYGIPLGISIGVVMVPEYGRDYDTLFALADSALYYVKQNGKHGFNVYDHTEMTKISEGGDLDNDLERMTRILEERDERGALLLGREAFAIAYRSSIRLCSEYGGEFTRGLFELLPRDGAGKKRLPEASSRFGYMLQRTLRKSDLIMQISTNQFYVLLNKRTQEEIEDELKGIVSEWENEEGGSDIAVKYAYRYVETKVEN
jgi:diguanylate cyclase (GGDEF)-like protein